jgi:hypothetical protein
VPGARFGQKPDAKDAKEEQKGREAGSIPELLQMGLACRRLPVANVLSA